MKRRYSHIAILAVILCVCSFAVPTDVSAQYSYTPLEKIPGTDTNSGKMADYIQAIYKFALWSVGIAAMFMLAIGGMMYLTSAGNTSQTSAAKKVIEDALVGLVLAFIAWLILYVINPDLVKVNLNFSAAGISTVTTAATSTTGTDGTATPTSGTGTAGSCNGLATQTGIDKQCSDVSAKLGDLLACIKGKYPNAIISSISVTAGFQPCKTAWTLSKCVHAQTSCHFGGGSAQTSDECSKSQAADFSVGGNATSQMSTDIQSAGNACGGRVLLEGSPAHVHISTQTTCCTL
jgi:hypothetical protein